MATPIFRWLVFLLTVGSVLGMTHSSSDEAAHTGGNRIGRTPLGAPRTDRAGNTHQRYQTTLNGIPVYGHQTIVHTKARDGSTRVTSTDLPSEISVNTTPLLSSDQASIIAIHAAGGADGVTITVTQIELNVWLREQTQALVWVVQTEEDGGNGLSAMPLLFVDAHSGEVISSFDNFKLRE